ncbi:MAG TPA: DUF1501 domain-containing protein [Nocardioides sp.]|nr:DUF1501 domain-containing protein [Nocardioides sp.]
MRAHPATCCEDPHGTSRRTFLRGALAFAGAATVLHGTTFTQTAFAADGAAERVLVVLSLRGAADGLNLVVPHGDPVYYQARPSIAVPSDRLLAKDGFFGLHPALAPLLPMWSAGRMAAVHAAGLPAPNRSHFSAMEELEDADPGSPERIGWLNRLVGQVGHGSPLDAIQLGSGVPATQLLGPHPVLATDNIASIELVGMTGAARVAARRASLATLWGDAAAPLAPGVDAALRVVDGFAPVRASSPTPANDATYPRSELAAALHAAARTIRADVGAEVITIDHGSWDHHTWIGTPDGGNLHDRATELAGAVAAFFTDLGTLGDRVTLVTISEFGRRVKENANQGLDHGYGNVMLLLGAGVKGGYHGTWPGLTNTVDADLLVTTDYRSVLTEVVDSCFDATPGQVFPGFTPTAVGAMA